MQKTTDSYIRAIGFKNFRRFKELNKLQLGNINLFVGQNNSGKSTVVKAILLVQEFLKEGDISKFSLTNKQLENTNIVTFGRAINADAAAKKEKTMSFHFEVANYSINFEVSGSDFDSNLPVSSFSIKLPDYTLSGKIIQNVINLTVLFHLEEGELEQDPIQQRIDIIKEQLERMDMAQYALESWHEEMLDTFHDSSNQIADLTETAIDNYNTLAESLASRFEENKIPFELGEILESIANTINISILNLFKNSKEEGILYQNEIISAKSDLQPIIGLLTSLPKASRNHMPSGSREMVRRRSLSLKIKFENLIEAMESLADQAAEVGYKKRPAKTKNTISISRADIDKHTERKKLEDELKRLQKAVKDKAKPETLAPLQYPIEISPNTTANLISILERLIIINEARKTGKESNEIKASVKYLKDTQVDLARNVAGFKNSISNLNLFHIGTNNGSQASILSVRDRNNPLAVAAHEFFQLKLNSDKDNPSRKFVTKWLEAFEVGEDVNIDQIAGEAYTIQIKTEGRWSNLSDMGMGAIQIVLLLLKLAAIIENTRTRKNTLSPTVLIEEPEINLHPKLQSKLADLFYAVQLEFGLQLIVETHSEYLIRRTQLLGLEENLFEEGEINPFKVHYFDKKDGPYEMIYQEDGKFDRKFGQGFYDVADAMAMETFKLNTKKKK